ncbi:hypothetical protein NDU88_003188 [Pleurodeles waltl]|uniref:Uncharacterized protein n=1 Tax=Pleurodeles waltl TaxID=8319 RepID=A0AAV7MTJ7_PLEWA|nr:hypothetical protein NDU88_003188 [Pleurodeles waltl]
MVWGDGDGAAPLLNAFCSLHPLLLAPPFRCLPLRNFPGLLPVAGSLPIFPFPAGGCGRLREVAGGETEESGRRIPFFFTFTRPLPLTATPALQGNSSAALCPRLPQQLLSSSSVADAAPAPRTALQLATPCGTFRLILTTSLRTRSVRLQPL